MILDRDQLLAEAERVGFEGRALEKVARLLHLLERINRDEYLANRLALKGGTAIHHFYLEAPRLFKFENDRMALSIKSRTAQVSSEGKTVDFQDDVVAVREATETQGKMTLTTDLLHVVPDDDYARTDSPVKIVDANTQVTAVGLELIDQGKVVKLLSNVRGSYVKQK